MENTASCDSDTSRAVAGHPILWVAIAWVAIAVFFLLQACLPTTDASRHFQDSSTASPDRFFNRLFTRSGPGWTGGDGAASVALPDGRSVWCFGDSFLGRVRPDRSRAKETPMIRNCLVVQKDNRLDTRHGGTLASPRARFEPKSADQWYWPADAALDDGKLWVWLWRFESSGTGMWDWRWIGTDLAALSLPDLRILSITPLPNQNRVMYGAAIVESPGYLYVYGVEERPDRRYLHLARTSRGGLLQPWQYFDGRRWSSEAGRSARIHQGTANQFSVIALAGKYVLITMDDRSPWSRDIVAYTADAPSGPWPTLPAALLYRAPLPGDDIVAYNALAHPQFTRNGRWLLSYNVNAVTDSALVYGNADFYRPWFIRVDLRRLLEDPGG